MSFRTLDDIGDLAGKRVLVREDLNVPMDGTRVTDAACAPPRRRSPNSPTRARSFSSSPTLVALRASAGPT